MPLDLMVILAEAAAAILVVVGVVFVFVGASGRKINDHFCCRRCGFDLFGLPLESDRCSECGADLKRPRAVRHGMRGKRWGVLATGAMMLVPATPVLLGLLWVRVAGMDLQQHKPLRWLEGEVVSTEDRVKYPALDEVLRRLRAGKLSAAEVQPFVTRALAVQGDATAPWSSRWADVVEEADAAGFLTAPQLAQYTKGLVRPELMVNSELRRGESLSMGLEFIPDRSVGGDPIRVAYTVTGIYVGDKVLPRRMASVLVGSWGSGSWKNARSQPPTLRLSSLQEPLRDLAAGEHSIVVNLAMHVTVERPGRVFQSAFRAGLGPMTTTTTSAPLTLRDRVPETLTRLSDPDWEAVKGKVRVECLVTPIPARNVGVFVSLPQAPADGAFSVWRLYEGGQRKRLGFVILRKGETAKARFTNAARLEPDERSLELMLSADVGLGEETPLEALLASRSLRMKRDPAPSPPPFGAGELFAIKARGE